MNLSPLDSSGSGSLRRPVGIPPDSIPEAEPDRLSICGSSDTGKLVGECTGGVTFGALRVDATADDLHRVAKLHTSIN
jgi:hypothetical protein